MPRAINSCMRSLTTHERSRCPLQQSCQQRSSGVVSQRTPKWSCSDLPLLLQQQLQRRIRPRPLQHQGRCVQAFCNHIVFGLRVKLWVKKLIELFKVNTLNCLFLSDKAFLSIL